MAKKAEATLTVKVVTKGKEALKTLGDGFKSLKDTVVDRGKEITLGIAAIGAAIVSLGTKAGKFDQVKESFESLVESQGQNADVILKQMKELTDGLVTELDLMVAANKAILLGLPIDKFPEMLKIAQSASEATGESMEFMLESIVTALGRSSKLILDNLGIVIDTEKAYEKYADTLNKTADALTDTEKKQAFINEAMEIGLKNAEKLGSGADNTSKQWNRFKVSIEETATSLGQVLEPIAGTIIESLQNLTDLAQDFARSEFLAFALNEINKVGQITIQLFKEIPLAFEDVAATFSFFKAGLFGDDEEKEAALKRIKDVDDRRRELILETDRKIRESQQQTFDELNKGAEASEESQTKLKKKFAEEKRKIEIKEAEKAAKEAAKEREKIEKKEIEDFRKSYEEAHEQERLNALREQEKKIEGFRKAFEDYHAFEEQEEERLRQERKQAEKQAIDDIILFSASSFTTGFEGLTKTALANFSDTFLPGLGGPISQMFDLLSQDSEQFINSINQLFSVQFLDNITENIPVLLDTLIEKLPEFVEKLVEVIIENVPQITIAMTKAISDPKFAEALVLAFANGIANGVKDGLENTRIALENIFGNFGKKVGEGFVEFFQDVGRYFKDLGKKIASGFNENLSIPGTTGSGEGFIDTVFGTDFGFAKGGLVPNRAIQKFASGGIVDSVPAFLTPGEFVVNPGATQQNLSTLQSINSGGSPSGGGETVININVNGGLLGDEQTARQFAKVIDEELLNLRRENESLVFDEALF